MRAVAYLLLLCVAISAFFVPLHLLSSNNGASDQVNHDGTGSNTIDIDIAFRNTAYTYDNAAAILVLLADGSPDSLRRATLISDAFVYASQNDRTLNDNQTCDHAADPLGVNGARLRNAYAVGDLASPPGWIPSGRVGTPGFYYEVTQTFYEVEHAATDVGTNPWAVIADQPCRGSMTSTGFASTGTQVFFQETNYSTCNQASSVLVTLTDMTDDPVADSYVHGYRSSVTHTLVIPTGVRDRRTLAEILDANNCGSDYEALDFDRNLLSEPCATIELIRSSLETSNSMLLDADAFATASESSLLDSNAADAGSGHHALRAIALTAARVIRRCGKRTGPNTPVKEGSDAVLATRYVDIDARIQPCPTEFLAWCSTEKCLPGDVGRPPS